MGVAESHHLTFPFVRVERTGAYLPVRGRARTYQRTQKDASPLPTGYLHREKHKKRQVFTGEESESSRWQNVQEKTLEERDHHANEKVSSCFYVESFLGGYK